MSDYNYSAGTFSNKDTLPSGNAAKEIKGSDWETEFLAIKTAVNSKADKAAPVFTGPIDNGTIDGGTF
jgi:hypothetical protein